MTKRVGWWSDVVLNTVSPFPFSINAINRGGLCTPSDLVHIVTAHAHEYFNIIFKNEKLREFFIPLANSRAMFVKSFASTLSNDVNLASLSGKTCAKNHSFMKIAKMIAFKMFNMSSKNYANGKNSELHAQRKRKRVEDKEDVRNSSSRKIAKLQSEST